MPKISPSEKMMSEIMLKINEYTLEEVENLVLSYKIKKTQKEDRIKKIKIEQEAKKMQRKIEKDLEEKLRKILEEEK